MRERCSPALPITPQRQQATVSAGGEHITLNVASIVPTTTTGILAHRVPAQVVRLAARAGKNAGVQAYEENCL